MNKRNEFAAHAALLASVDHRTIRLEHIEGLMVIVEGETETGETVSASMPRLSTDAPYIVETGWASQAFSMLTGRCRLCDEVTNATETGLELIHDTRCPARVEVLDEWLLTNRQEIA